MLSFLRATLARVLPVLAITPSSEVVASPAPMTTSSAAVPPESTGPRPTKVSPAGRALIETFEGCRTHAYQDERGIWTIGYGHTGPDVVEGLVYTQAQCDAALTHRLSTEFEPAVAAVSIADTTQHEFDAMVCLTYNIGVGGFNKSTVKRKHEAGDKRGASQAFLLWDKPASLAPRREIEAQIYFMGKWNHNPSYKQNPVYP
jgi:lysozyme